jgi:hypothetical protein
MRKNRVQQFIKEDLEEFEEDEDVMGAPHLAKARQCVTHFSSYHKKKKKRKKKKKDEDELPDDEDHEVQ